MYRWSEARNNGCGISRPEKGKTVRGMLRIYVAKMNTESMMEREGEYLSRLPAWRQEKAKRLRRPVDRAVSVGAWLLAEHALEKEFGLLPGDYRVKLGERGKPELVAGDKNVFFSLSHTGNIAAVATAEYPVGLDIEQKEDPGLRMAYRMFAPAEKERLEGFSKSAAGDAPESQMIFRDIWTGKEAYLKYTGEGISVALSSFYADEASGRVYRKRRKAAGYYPEDCFIKTLRLENGLCSLSVCTPEEDLETEICFCPV